MNTIWESVTWNVARAGGFTAYILLALAVIAGLALSTQIQSPARWPRLLNNELHNFLTLLGTIFLGIHLLAVWIDPFTSFGWNEVLIPLASHYRSVWMALGIVALYLGLAIGLSTLIRPRIGYKWWRRLHILTLGIFALATLHGLGTGSDTQTAWALGHLYREQWDSRPAALQTHCSGSQTQNSPSSTSQYARATKATSAQCFRANSCTRRHQLPENRKQNIAIQSISNEPSLIFHILLFFS